MQCVIPKLISIFAFLMSFTIVMSLLFYITDLKGDPRKIVSVITSEDDLINLPQEAPVLIDYIRNRYLKHPNSTNTTEGQKYKSDINLIFDDMANGKFIEVGASSEIGSTEFLLHSLNWTGLVVEPHPDIYDQITKLRSVNTANICISPTRYPQQALFKSSKGHIMIQCFPLYSVMSAFQTLNLDLLKLNLKEPNYQEEANYQVLKTLPWPRVCIKVISVPISSKYISHVTQYLSAIGYTPNKLVQNTQHYYFSYKNKCIQNKFKLFYK